MFSCFNLSFAQNLFLVILCLVECWPVALEMVCTSCQSKLIHAPLHVLCVVTCMYNIDNCMLIAYF